MDGIPPIDPLEHEQYARARERDHTEGRSGVERRMGANLMLLGLLLVAGVIIFLLTR